MLRMPDGWQQVTFSGHLRGPLGEGGLPQREEGTLGAEEAWASGDPMPQVLVCCQPWGHLASLGTSVRWVLFFYFKSDMILKHVNITEEASQGRRLPHATILK